MLHDLTRKHPVHGDRGKFCHMTPWPSIADKFAGTPLRRPTDAVKDTRSGCMSQHNTESPAARRQKHRVHHWQFDVTVHAAVKPHRHCAGRFPRRQTDQPWCASHPQVDDALIDQSQDASPVNDVLLSARWCTLPADTTTYCEGNRRRWSLPPSCATPA